MNKINKECNIIMDLLPNYIDKLVSADTDEFITNHIKECPYCQDKLNKMNSEINNNRTQLENNSISKSKILKRIRKRMIFWKYCLILSCILIVLFLSYIVFNIIFSFNVMKNVYEEYSYINNLDNYCVTKYTIYNNYRDNESFSSINKTYFKDKKYKEDIYYTNINTLNTSPDYSNFGQLGSNEKTSIIYNNKIATKRINSSIYYLQGQLIKNDFVNNYCLPSIRYLHVFKFIELRQFAGKDCYVFKIKNKYGYTEYWIQKDTYFNVRTVESYIDYYRETLYSLDKDIVTNEDIEINYPNDFEYTELHTNDITENIDDIKSYIESAINN